jgi:hypothetical protein
MSRNRRSFKRVALGGVVLAATTAVIGTSMLAAHADTTVSATGANAAEASSAAYAICQAQGYNANTILSTVTNSDGSVTVTMNCYTV